jgi:hypothetical protein
MSDYGTVATLPLAPGTASTCYTYHNYYDSPNRPAVVEPEQQLLWSAPPGVCEAIAGIVGIDVEELIRLNPSLEAGNCVMERGFSYCAEESRESRKTRKTNTGGHLYYRFKESRRLSQVTASATSPTQTPDPPICHFDPKKGEYVCPDQPICRFDPKKGKYVCPNNGLEKEGKPNELK